MNFVTLKTRCQNPGYFFVLDRGAQEVTDNASKTRLSTLRKKRGVLRGSVSKLLHRIDNLTMEESLKEVDVGTLEDLGEVLEEKKINLNEMDMAIEPGVDPAELEDEWQNNEEYMENIIIRRNKIKRILHTMAKNEREGSESLVYSRVACTVKLPRLVIEKYHGEVSLWQIFWNQFDMAVHQN